MPDYPQPLGKSMKDMGMPVSMDSKSADEMMYPHVTLEWDKEYDLPESGTITFAFKKASETTNPKPRPGQPKQRVELDLTSIEDVEESEPTDNPEEESADVLDKAAKKAMDAENASEDTAEGSVEE
jgi:hypothetical protein